MSITRIILYLFVMISIIGNFLLCAEPLVQKDQVKQDEVTPSL